MLRLGFIGCGTHATMNLYPALRFAPCELVAVADPLEDRRAYCARVFGAKQAYSDYGQMLEREKLDAVIVCGPPKLHHEAGVRALKAGLHVMVEKPPAETLEGVLELRQAARDAKRVCMCAFMKRFAQKYRKAFEISQRPDFGGRQHLLVRYSHGAAMDAGRTYPLMAIHAIDLVRHFMGDARRVQLARMDISGGTSVAAVFQCEQGIATLISMSSEPAVMERLELTGDGEKIVVDELSTLVHYGRGKDIWAPPSATLLAGNPTLQTEANASGEIQGYIGEVREFVSAATENRPPCGATIDDGVRAMQIIKCIEPVTWGEVEIPADD